MPPLSGNALRTATTGKKSVLIPAPIKADTVIWTGALVAAELASGLAVPAADAAGLRFLGIAFRGSDNRGRPDGRLIPNAATGVVEIDQAMRWSVRVEGANPKTGDQAWVIDDNTISVEPTANSLPCGRITEPDPEILGHWFLDIERDIFAEVPP